MRNCPSSRSTNVHAKTGTRLFEIQTSRNDSLDPSACRIQFDRRNRQYDVERLLCPLGGPWAFFWRLRVMSGNKTIGDIDNCNHTHEMFSIFSATDSRENEYTEGFGNYRAVNYRDLRRETFASPSCK